MKFATLDSLIQRCESHLDATGTRNTDIENYFVQFLLIRICSEYESRVTSLVHRRCSRPRDIHLRSFAQQTAEYVSKRFDIGDIGKVLQRFGNDYKTSFNTSVMSGSGHAAWNNIYTNRQAVAHRAGTQMSLGDLKTNYANSLAVLDALAVALELRPGEMRRFK
jgi:RiboL-PSP-HEPN